MSYGLRNLIDASTLPRREKTVAREVAFFKHDDRPGPVEIYLRQLVNRTGYCDRTIRSILGRLRKKGVVSIRRPRVATLPCAYDVHATAIPGITDRDRQIALRFPQRRGPES